MVEVEVLVFLLGLAIVLFTMTEALKTVVVPRAVSSLITRSVFIWLGRVFDRFARLGKTYSFRDSVLAYYAPVSLVLLPGVWVLLIIVGYSFMFWAVGSGTYAGAFTESGSSMLTLGFVAPSGTGEVFLAFTEATLGLGVVALLISYLPSIYGAFSRREQLVGQLEARAGIPPSPAELLIRYRRIGWLEDLDRELFPKWEAWFIDVEESHTSLASLVFFRSPQPERNWVTAAGCVLDTASIYNSTIANHESAPTSLMLRTGFLALRRIADNFGIRYPVDVDQDTPIAVSRREFDLVCIELTAAGLELKPDLDQAWRDFVGWRANYDTVLLSLAALVDAPPARWSSDRAPRKVRPKVLRRRPRRTIS